MRRRLPRAFYRPDVVVLAPQLLGKLLVRADGRAGRIIEVEAYRGSDDPASHAYRGPTKRTMVMWGPPGHLYVYFTYGMHWCANVVCGPPGVAGAVLLRALEPVSGLPAMRQARWPSPPPAVGVATPPPGADTPDAAPAVRLHPRPDRDLCRGPARLCQALGIDGSFDGVDLAGRGGEVWLADDGVAPPADPEVTTRIGISVGTELPWRWAYRDDPGVSRWRAPVAKGGRPASTRRETGPRG